MRVYVRKRIMSDAENDLSLQNSLSEIVKTQKVALHCIGLCYMKPNDLTAHNAL